MATPQPSRPLGFGRPRGLSLERSVTHCATSIDDHHPSGRRAARRVRTTLLRRGQSAQMTLIPSRCFYGPYSSQGCFLTAPRV